MEALTLLLAFQLLRVLLDGLFHKVEASGSVSWLVAPPAGHAFPGQMPQWLAWELCMVAAAVVSCAGDMTFFLRQFVRSPGRTGAVAPSSRHLAAQMIRCANLPATSVVIEMGPGTGVFTERLTARLTPGTDFFALEINPRFAEATRRRCPGVTVHQDSATNARAYLDRIGKPHCDLVVSSLPWASFRPSLQEEILDTIVDILRPGGRLLTFAYLQGLALPSGQRFRKALDARFSGVERTRTVWRNVPPAFIYRAVK